MVISARSLSEVEGRIANFNFGPAHPALSNIARVTGDKYAGRQIDPYNFAPRVGFAYSLSVGPCCAAPTGFTM